jgi:hypothetical protein
MVESDGARLFPLRVLLVNDDQPVGIVEGQRTVEHAVGDAEDRGVCADAERQRNDSHQGESRRPQQRTNPVPHITHETVEGRKALLVPVVFLDRFHRTELLPRLASCFEWRQAGLEIFRSLQRQVLLEHFPQTLLVAPPRCRRGKPQQKPPQRSHGRSSAGTISGSVPRSTSLVLFTGRSFWFPTG